MNPQEISGDASEGRSGLKLDRIGDINRRIRDSTGNACAVLAAAAFATILEADQIDLIKTNGSWMRTWLYGLLAASIPVNLWVYDHLLERNIGRRSTLINRDKAIDFLLLSGWM